MKILSNWYSVLDSNRNNLVFENRNREYGAYVIRREHHKDVLRAFFYAITGIGLIVCIPYVIKLINKGDIVVPVVKSLDLNDLSDYRIPDQQIVKTQIQQPATHATTQSTVPEVAPDEQITTTPATNDQLQTDQIGATTTSGGPNVGENTIPVEPPVAEAAPVLYAEVMPEFPGGSDKLLKYIVDHIKYPKMARENNIIGTVGVTWVIDREGFVRDVQIIRSVHPSLDAEAKRVIESLPQWTPGKQNGKPVSVMFTMPIRFNLQ